MAKQTAKQRREAAAAEEKRLLAGLARWERKQKKERAERAQRAAETRRVNKAAAEAAARKRQESAGRAAATRKANKKQRQQAEAAAKQKRSEAAKRAAATRAANRASEGGKAPSKAASPVSVAKRGGLQGSGGAIRTLEDWERRGDWLQPGAQQAIYHVGSEYRSRKGGSVKTELAVKVQQQPGTKLTAKMLREAAAYWIDTGQQPAGMEFTAIHWSRGTRGREHTLNVLVDGPEAMEAARQQMLVRFFHLGK